jgi:hypothetical protein
MINEKISIIIKNTEAFQEKGRQVTPGNFEAFGIPISSRHAKAREIIELLSFAEAAARACVAHYVKSAFYDSKSSCCSFELDPAVHYGDEIEMELRAIGNQTLTQFDWFGTILHGRGFTEEDKDGSDGLI